MSLNHTAGVHGHKRVGLTNDLDGSEDILIRRQAKICWDQLGMSAIRDVEVAAVLAKVADGSLTWSREMLESLVEPFSNDDYGGVTVEGQEFEGSVSSDSDDPPWAADDGDSEDDSDGYNGGDALAIKKASALDCVVALAGDDPAEVEEVKVFAAKKAELERMRQPAKENYYPALQGFIERTIDQLEKEHHLGKGKKGPTAAMARFVREKRKRDDDELHAQREVNVKRRAELKEEASARKNERRSEQRKQGGSYEEGCVSQIFERIRGR